MVMLMIMKNIYFTREQNIAFIKVIKGLITLWNYIVRLETVIRDFTQELMQQLQEWGKLKQQDLEVESEKAAKELVAELKQTSPKKTGKYAKGWRIKKRGTKYIVHNATDYQLTHLLEHGHAKRNGGRTAAKVHIRPAEQKMIREFQDALKRMLEE